MRIAALYDIHGNLPALEAILDDVEHEDVDRVVVGGDVLPGPMPDETLTRLLELDLPTVFIYGNGEADALTELDGGRSRAPDTFRGAVRWSAEALPPERVEVVRSWPPTVREVVPGLGRVLFCHATPGSDTDIVTRLTPEDEVGRLIEGAEADVIVCGHTHMQFDRSVGGVRIVNAGSVGMPFGEPGAYWLLLGPAVELRRTRYDVHDAARRIRGTSYPRVDAFVGQSLLDPPTEESMLEVFGGGVAP